MQWRWIGRKYGEVGQNRIQADILISGYLSDFVWDGMVYGNFESHPYVVFFKETGCSLWWRQGTGTCWLAIEERPLGFEDEGIHLAT